MSETPLLDPWSLPRPKLPEKTFTAKDGKTSLTLTLRALDVPTAGLAGAEAAELIWEFIPRDGEPAPPLYPSGGGEVVRLSRGLISDLCTIRWMDTYEPRRAFDWWLGVALRLPRAYRQITEQAQRLNQAADADAEPEDEEGN